MMCSRLLKPPTATARLAGKVLRFHRSHVRGACATSIRARLHSSLDYLPVTSVFALIVLSSIYFLYAGAKSELAPQEDQAS